MKKDSNLAKWYLLNYADTENGNEEEFWLPKTKCGLRAGIIFSPLSFLLQLPLIKLRFLSPIWRGLLSIVLYVGIAVLVKCFITNFVTTSITVLGVIVMVVLMLGAVKLGDYMRTNCEDIDWE